MTNEDIKAWRTIVKILRLTGYYDFYEDEVSRIANILRKVGEE
jgi:hypothetical protein